MRLRQDSKCADGPQTAQFCYTPARRFIDQNEIVREIDGELNGLGLAGVECEGQIGGDRSLHAFDFEPRGYALHP